MPVMKYVAIGSFSKDATILAELASQRRDYQYPPAFKNVASYLDVQGGRAVVIFETDDPESILRYTSDWSNVTFDVFPVVPSDKGWLIYLNKSLK
jgi:hypothetical protein